ncbi:MAG: hypothetical protein CVV11_01910 [Gammaproteobacteria bacterium HGW-Gammaproteobacteria-15]|nr:MAG: hypothetical protein CVV11_01910 [Gammaproteobacteria bacterium HGW-Gammaproteobacteria-15]
MNLGDWDSAVVKSILFVGLIIAFLALFTGLFPKSLNDVVGLLVFFFLYIGVYILISIIGWLLIGFPIHWLACKYTNGSFFYYLVLPVIFLMLALFNDGPVLFSLAPVLQAFFFRYFVYRDLAR